MFAAGRICLRARGIKKGDRVILYLPMIPEAAMAMLACARIGAVHAVVFAGFRHRLCATASTIQARHWSSPQMSVTGAARPFH
jgi:acyl-coenzyme A synthetase/AMP-(fatty) acid ligase